MQKTQKLSLATLQGKLTRDEMKKIKGGTCVNVSCDKTTPPAGACSVSGGPNRCCWQYC